MTLSTVPPAIEPAQLNWQHGVPELKNVTGAPLRQRKSLAAFRYELIEPSNLPARFASVPEAGSFVVAQCGFGSGLSFLATWQAWQVWSPSHSATLHFVACERFPLTLQDLEKTLLLWPELQDLADELIACYPPLVRGAHRLVLAGGRVRLTLFFGDQQTAWNSLDFKADAWFLDGVEPAPGPEQAQEIATNQLRQHSKPGTTVFSCCAAEETQSLLTSAGLRMQKADGFEPNQETLNGVFSPESLPPTVPEALETHTNSVAVIGAGIAGCLLANNLAGRGYSVTLIDAADEPGLAASGNLQGAMYVKLGVEFNHQTELALSALTFSQRYYFPYRGQYWHPTGLIQLAWSDTEQSRQRRFIERNQYPENVLRPVSRKEAEILTGARLMSGGLWFPGCGWLEPAKLCKELTLHTGIRKAFAYPVTQIQTFAGKWHISGAGSDSPDIHSNQVVICAGHLTPQLIPDSDTFRFKAIRGQVTHLPGSLVDSPRAVICGARYFNPAYGPKGEQVAVIGATFDLHSDEPGPTIESHRENIRELSSMVPNILSENMAAGDLPAQLAGRVGFRCTTHDYQPVAGPLCDTEGQKVEGLYLLTGMGSKGLTYAPLLAEFVADQLTGQPCALPMSLAKRVATGRMRQKKLAPT